MCDMQKLWSVQSFLRNRIFTMHLISSVATFEKFDLNEIFAVSGADEARVCQSIKEE